MPSGKRRGALLYFVLPRPFVELQLHRVEALVDMRFNQNVHWGSFNWKSYINHVNNEQSLINTLSENPSTESYLPIHYKTVV